MRSKERIDALAGKAKVDGTVMIIDSVNLIRAVLNCRMKKKPNLTMYIYRD